MNHLRLIGRMRLAVKDPRLNASYMIFAISLVIVYAAVYGTLIGMASGMPYVMDNNESFSSLWHAHNLFHYGFEKTYGLADEAFAFHAEAHPFAHTHQGNFPRIYASLIYALGARSIEAQIIVTTFTMGLFGVLLAFHYFTRVSNTLFAFVVSVLLMTDYVLVAQWQVNTYRVWYEIFIFSTILCIHELGSGKTRWKILTVAAFACLFYFEFVFVAFLSLSCALYALGRYRRKLRTLLWALGLMGVGATLGLSVLTAQLVLYLGWTDFLTDAYYTFIARNYFRDDASMLRAMANFFDTRHIAFWFNLEDGARFRDVKLFIASLTQYEFQPHTPLFTAICAIIAVGLLWSMLANRTLARNISARNEDAGTVKRLADILSSYPVVLACAIVAVHLGHRFARGSFGALQGYAVVGAAISLVLIPVLYLRKQTIDVDSGSLAAASNFQVARYVALAVLACIGPSVILHMSSEPVLFDKYSALFCAFLVVYVGFAFHLVRDQVGRGRNILSAPLKRLFRVTRLLSVGTLIVFSFTVTLLVFTDEKVALGIAGDLPWYSFASPIKYAAFAAAAIVFSAFLYAAAGAVTSSTGAVLARGTGLRVAVFVSATSLALAGQASLYNQRYSLVWERVQDRAFPPPVQYAILGLAIVVAVLIVAGGGKAFIARWLTPRFRSLGLFFGAGLIAYAIVYPIFPGYIFTGYRFRSAPLTVFHTQIITAFAFYVLLGLGLNVLPRRRHGQVEVTPPLQLFRDRAGRATGGAALILLGSLIWFWMSMQSVYVDLLSPNSYPILRRLSEPPYAGASFIANTYAAPVAAMTGEWAYFHGAIAEHSFIEHRGQVRIQRDKTYLWLADKQTNSAYDRPQYYICLTPPSWSALIEHLRRDAGLDANFGGCEEDALVRIASGQDTRRIYPSLTVTETDTDGIFKVGYQRWAIIRLGW